MPILDITQNITDGQTPKRSDLDAICSDIELFFNSVKIDALNISAGSLILTNFQDSCFTTVKIADDAVTTAKITDGVIKQSDLEIMTTDSTYISSGTTTATSYTTIDNISITTEGFPVFITVHNSEQNPTETLVSGNGFFLIARGATDVAYVKVDSSQKAPLSVIDSPVAGTYTYTLKFKSSGGGNPINIHKAYFRAYEMRR